MLCRSCCTSTRTASALPESTRAKSPTPRSPRWKRWRGRTSIHCVARRRRRKVRISRELEISLALAVNEARRRRHEYVCTEHLLYALLHDGDVAEVVRHSGGDVPALKRAL